MLQAAGWTACWIKPRTMKVPHQHAFIDLHRSGDDDDDDNGKLIIIVKEICMSFNYHEHYTLYKIRVCTKACNVEKKQEGKHTN